MRTATLHIESRRDQEGGELDSLEEASPEEIKSREVVRESWTSASVFDFMLLNVHGGEMAY